MVGSTTKLDYTTTTVLVLLTRPSPRLYLLQFSVLTIKKPNISQVLGVDDTTVLFTILGLFLLKVNSYLNIRAASSS